MPPALASLVYGVLIVGLLLWDRDRTRPVSAALWLPFFWIAIGATRNVSEWLGMGVTMNSANDMAEGSPLDRVVTFGLLAAALLVLLVRGRRSTALLWANLPILLFLIYCGLSAAWSDLPFVTFKRWTKALGNVAMVLVVLSDPEPAAAAKRLFARLGFVLLILSTLFIKYFPNMGRAYDMFTGTPVYTGVTTNKNSLGCLVLVLGLSTLWLLLESFHDTSRKRQRVIVFGALLTVALWLLYQADSATSLACFAVGAAILLLFNGSKRPAGATLIHVGVLVPALAGVVAYAAFDAQTSVLEAMGRDATLTGRTELWATLLRIDTSPWVGAGFESFFLGDRLDYLWNRYWWHPNEAHNGYLEIYLTLGWVGLGLFALLIVSGYRRITQAYRDDPRSASLRLAFWATFLLYNMTEAAMKVMHPVWILFVLAISTAPPLVHEARARRWQRDAGHRHHRLQRLRTSWVPRVTRA